jgi:hypothetical protein
MAHQISLMDLGQATETVAQIVLSELKRSLQRIDQLLDLLPDSKLSRRTKVPCDCGLYILGHLVSRLDILLESLSVSEQRFHELEEIFVLGCNYRDINQLSAATLRDSWNIIKEISIFELTKVHSTDWFDYPPANSRITKLKLPRHSRIAILISFSHDVAYHAGRLARVV